MLLPNQSHLGVSRKIEKEEERQRLKELAHKLGLPPEMGLIIRTAGETSKNLDLAKDMKYLLKLWEIPQPDCGHTRCPLPTAPGSGPHHPDRQGLFFPGYHHHHGGQ